MVSGVVIRAHQGKAVGGNTGGQAILSFLSAFVIMSVVSADSVGTARAQDLRIYGPGGPEPAIREAAGQFGAAHGIKIEVTAGPLGKWIEVCR